MFLSLIEEFEYTLWSREWKFMHYQPVISIAVTAWKYIFMVKAFDNCTSEYIHYYNNTFQLSFGECIIPPQSLVLGSFVLWLLLFKEKGCDFESSDRGSERRPNLAKETSCRRRAIYLARELAIFIFFFCMVPIHIFYFLILLSLH